MTVATPGAVAYRRRDRVVRWHAGRLSSGFSEWWAVLVVPLVSIAFGAASVTIVNHPLSIFAVVVGIGGVAVGLHDWRLSLYGLLAYLPVSGVAIIFEVPNRAVAVLAKDLLFVIPAYLGALAWVTARRGRAGFPGAPTRLIVLFSLLVTVQILNPAVPTLLVGAIGAKVWLLYIPLLFLGYHLVRSQGDLFRLLGLMSIGAVIPAVIGLVEVVLVHTGQAATVYNLYGESANDVTQNFSVTSYEGGGALHRVASTFSFQAQYYAFLVAMVAVTYAWSRGALAERSGRFLGRLVWLLMIIAALLSGSRGAFIFVPLLVLLTVLLESGLSPRGLGRFVAPAALVAAAAATIGAASATVVSFATDLSRGYIADVFINGFRRALEITWVGLGTGTDTNASRYVIGQEDLFAQTGGWFESWYVKLVLELGVLGLLLMLMLLTLLIRRGFAAHRRVHDPRLKAVSAALLAFLIWNLIYNVKGGWVDIDPVNVYFWLFVGVLLKLPRLEARAPAQEATAVSPVR
jgi:hypothetical protein